jgi:hypothetical protein
MPNFDSKAKNIAQEASQPSDDGYKKLAKLQK